MLELRPPIDADKGTAVRHLLTEAGLSRALFAGDDTTDVDAFRRLRRLVAEGALEGTVCVGVASAETPAGVYDEADLVVEGTDGFVRVLEMLSG